jgi:hypothetical protein
MFARKSRYTPAGPGTGRHRGRPPARTKRHVPALKDTIRHWVKEKNRTEQRTLNLRAYRSSCRGSRRQPTDFYLRLGPGSASSTDVADGTPPILHAGSAPVGLAPRSQQHERTSRPGDPGMSPAQVYGGYMTGLSPVHGGHIDRLCRIQSLTGGIGNPLRHDAAAPAARLCRSSIPAAATGTRPTPQQQPGWGWYRSGSPPRPQARIRPARRPARAGRRRTEPAGRDVRHIGQTSSPGARIMGQNGRGSAKRAVIRTARSARTLSAICP